MLTELFQKILDKIKELVNKAVGNASATVMPDMSSVDLMAVLEKEAEGKNLNWKTSVVDFLTLLKIDSSKENRAELAKELNVSNEFKIGSAEGNEALRVAVFKKLQENGGNIPPSLLD